MLLQAQTQYLCTDTKFGSNVQSQLGFAPGQAPVEGGEAGLQRLADSRAVRKCLHQQLPRVCVL